MPEIKDWRNRVERYRLVGSICNKCGKRYYPKRAICRVCGSRDLSDIQLPERGKLVTYTIIRVPPEKYKRYAPYVVGVVELEDGTRIMAQITDVELENVKIGMELEVTLRKLYEYGEEGHIVYGIKFRPSLKS